MALFDIPGWNIPSDVKPAANTKSRKRKRGPGDDSSSRLRSAEVNTEKLMEKLTDVQSASKPKKKKKKTSKDNLAPRKEQMAMPRADSEESRQPNSMPTSTKEQTLVTSKKRTKKKRNKPSIPHDSRLNSVDSKSSRTPAKIEASSVKEKKNTMHERNSISKLAGSASMASADLHLTNLQSRMKQSLDGARFRWINETLYKSDSHEAERLMQEDPKVFEEYHAGFRHQVTSWPRNPVDHFSDELSSYPKCTVIVDLGCGDATLAQKLVPEGYTVVSFDLISANPFIVSADICRRLPLPGSETEEEGQIVDVVVCCLSLMNTNWLNCIREARRVLKKGGELKIAEVASRFTDVDKFTSVICSVGFRLVSKDGRNSHFTLFDFKKAEGSMNLDDKVWQKVLARGDVLQPCEYKRR